MYKKKLIFLVVFFIFIDNTIVSSEEIRVNRDYTEEGVNLLKKKQYDEAIIYFNQAVKFTPNNGDIYFGKGIALDNLRKYQEAINEFDKALKYFNDSSHKKIQEKFLAVLNRKSLSLISLNRYEEALNNYNKAIELDPSYFRSYIGKGDTLYYLKKYTEAINEYNKALEVLNNSPSKETRIKHLFGLYNNKGASLLALGRYEEAIDNYNRAIEFKPDHIEANANKLCPLYRLGRYQEVVGTADKILELDPKNQKAINFKDQALIQLKKS